MGELLHMTITRGALSGPAGRLRMLWTRDEQNHVQIQWQESDGPVPGEDHRGTPGMDLARGLIEFELGGKAEFDFPEQGVRHLLRFQYDHTNGSVGKPGVSSGGEQSA